MLANPLSRFSPTNAAHCDNLLYIKIIFPLQDEREEDEEEEGRETTGQNYQTKGRMEAQLLQK